MMVGRWVSFWDCLFLGAMLNFRGVLHWFVLHVFWAPVGWIQFFRQRLLLVVVVGWSSQAFVEGSQIEDFEARKCWKKAPKEMDARLKWSSLGFWRQKDPKKSFCKMWVIESRFWILLNPFDRSKRFQWFQWCPKFQDEVETAEREKEDWLRDCWVTRPSASLPVSGGIWRAHKKCTCTSRANVNSEDHLSSSGCMRGMS